MKMKIFLNTFVILFIVMSTSYAGTFKVDSDYTTVGFRIQHIMGRVFGVFKKYSGTIKLDDKNSSLVSLEASIDVSSVDTRQKDRDKDLRSERFFDVAKFPEMKFVSKSISSHEMKGDLTIHGVTKEVVLEYVFYGLSKDQHGRTKVFLSINGAVNRKDFGINFNTKTDDGKLLLGDYVELMIEAQGIFEK